MEGRGRVRSAREGVCDGKDEEEMDKGMEMEGERRRVDWQEKKGLPGPLGKILDPPLKHTCKLSY